MKLPSQMTIRELFDRLKEYGPVIDKMPSQSVSSYVVGIAALLSQRLILVDIGDGRHGDQMTESIQAVVAMTGEQADRAQRLLFAELN